MRFKKFSNGFVRPLGGLFKTLNNLLHILSSKISHETVLLLMSLKNAPTLSLKTSLT